ncbi:auxin efflux carrier family protein [Marchantia polymorpha subsp. ruderalis]
MAAMTGEDFWLLLQYILPFFIILLPAYGMARTKILTQDHALGLNRWTSLVGVPIYVGHMVATNDPYQTNLRLVGADALQKIVVLLIALVWWRFSKRATIDGVITFFMLSTLSNMVLVGPALFRPLHGTASDVSIATIILLQCVLWYNLCIAMFEIRNVMNEMGGKDNETLKNESANTEEPHPSALPGLPLWSSTESSVLPTNKDARSLKRSISAPTRVSFSTSRIVPLFNFDQVEEDSSSKDGTINKPKDIQITFDIPGGVVTKTIENTQIIQIETPETAAQRQPTRAELSRFTYVKIVAFKVVNRVKYAPLLYTSSIGFIYSLFAFKYNWTMPYTIITPIEMIAKGAIAISVVTMALTWSQSGKLVSCGYKRMFYGWFIRFIVGPVIMVITSLAFGLKGISFEFSVLQAALPVGLVSFVLAKEYKLDVEVFSTAVITQLVIFLPIVVVYFFILQVVE